MLTAALQITAACLAVAAVLVGVRQITLWLARYDDTLNNTTDEHSQRDNFGFEAGQFIQHGSGTSDV